MSTFTRIVHSPVPYEGTGEERAANFNTHHFWSDDPDGCDARCMGCDCRPTHAAASYPCGTEPPRRTVEITVAS